MTIDTSAKSLVVVFSSHHHNTERVARALAEVLGAPVKTPEQVNPAELGEYGLVGFGSGIDSGKHYRPLLDLVDALPRVTGKRAFIFSTRGAPDALARSGSRGEHGERNHALLRAKLASKGYTVIGEFSCAGFNTNSFLKLFGGLNKGRPDAADLRNAQDFARGLEAKVRG